MIDISVSGLVKEFEVGTPPLLVKRGCPMIKCPISTQKRGHFMEAIRWEHNALLPVHPDILQMDGAGLILQARQVGTAGFPATLHPVQSPEQIYCREWACRDPDPSPRGCGTDGMGGSMHAFFLPFGIYPNNAIVGGSATIATGAALFKKCNVSSSTGPLPSRSRASLRSMASTTARGLCNIGDGSLGRGPVWEAMNFACMDQFHTLWEKGQDRGMPILRALTLAEQGQLALHGVHHRQGVVAVNALGVELGGGYAGTHTQARSRPRRVPLRRF